MSEPRIVRIVRTGQQRAVSIIMATQEITKERMATCRSCEHFRLSFQQCKLCGCFMPAKARIKGSTCPDGRW